MSFLFPSHQNMLEQESAIGPEVIQARGYKTVSTKAELARLGFSATQQNTPTLVIPLHGVIGEIVSYQSRPDSPRIDRRSGKAIKYETPANSRMVLDVHPHALANIKNPNVPLFITEGIKKGDALVSHGLCAIALIGVWNWRGTNEQGGKAALADWESIPLNGRKVYIVFDSDVMEKQPVHHALIRLKAFLESRGAVVLLIYLPHGEGGKKQGVDDFLASGKSVDDLFSYATPDLKHFKTETSHSGLPEIVVNGRHLRDITQDALQALRKANEPPTLFVRGPALARVNEARVEILTRDGLKGILDRTANFVTEKEDEPEPTPARPPSDLAPDIMSLQHLPFPRLEGISSVPLFLPDGSLLCESGYHPESGLYLCLEGLEGVTANMRLDKAVDLLLEELYGDFPFADEAGRAHILCMLLEPFVQRLVGNVTPLYLVDAPIRGTGKGLLYEATVLIVTGRTAPVMVLPKEGDELEKRITSFLLESATYLLLDNTTSIKSPVLAAAITSSVWRGRRLGQSQMLEVPNTATWVATGNNVELSDEIARRIIPIRLDPGVERPEHRTGFKHPNLKAWVLEKRSTLVSACLSLIQAWINEGMLQGKEKLGSFETWCAVMGGILGVSGVSGFLSGRERLHEDADRTTREWAGLLKGWFETYGTNKVSAKDVFTVAADRKLLLDLWGGRSALSGMQRFGHALNSHRDRVFAGYKILLAGQDTYTGNTAYRLEKLGQEKTPKTPETPLDTKRDTGVSGVFSPPSFQEDDDAEVSDDLSF